MFDCDYRTLKCYADSGSVSNVSDDESNTESAELLHNQLQQQLEDTSKISTQYAATETDSKLELENFINNGTSKLKSMEISKDETSAEVTSFYNLIIKTVHLY